MRQLTGNQQNYVWALVENGGDPTKAAAVSGFGGTDLSRRQAVHRLTHDPKVQSAIREVAEARIRAGVLLGASVLVEIASDPLHKQRLKAAEALLDRGGMMLVRETKMTVEHKDPSVEATIARIRALAEGMGMDARPLLLNAGVPQNVVDAEFEVVQVGSTAGLEDLL